MAGEALAGVGCCSCVGIFVFLLLSFSSVAPTEIALRYNRILKSVNHEPVETPGLKFMGPFNTLITYPKTILTMEYDYRHRDMLDGRTKDGLPLSLAVAFQYRLLPERLYDLYNLFENSEGDYENIYKLFGIHLITEISTNYTAYQFFNEKQTIADEMRGHMDAYFQKHLFAEIVSLQINDDTLPPAFTDSVLHAATVKQNISQMSKTQEAKVVEFETNVMVAENQANVTIQKAQGESYRILQNARADASIVELQTQAEIISYDKVSTKLNLKGDGLIKYMWFDSLGGGGVNGEEQTSGDVQLLVGVNPAAYISQRP